MAVELYSDNPSSVEVMSPRISFSYDLCQSDVAAVEQQNHPLRSNSLSSRSMNSSMEFDFCVSDSFEQESSSADELFSDGKMIPTEIKKKSSHQPKQLDQIMPPLLTAPATNQRDPKITTAKKSKIMTNSSSSGEGDQKQSSKSFWGFKRSSSCGSGYGRTLCPLQLLPRSNSTGSSSSAKRSLFLKEGQNQKQNSHKSASKKPSSSQYSSAPMSNYQKPPLKKGQYGSYGGNAVPFSPVLNIPTANMFGFGSIFPNGKDKTRKK
ncbi:uncharacterized protein [Pyrus communis]|uniref:uncharacterized protein n=1 Tax=Pyrus communis TaxID=23211 RepID=UPI0035C05574